MVGLLFNAFCGHCSKLFYTWTWPRCVCAPLLSSIALAGSLQEDSFGVNLTKHLWWNNGQKDFLPWASIWFRDVFNSAGLKSTSTNTKSLQIAPSWKSAAWRSKRTSVRSSIGAMLTAVRVSTSEFYSEVKLFSFCPRRTPLSVSDWWTYCKAPVTL